MKKDNATDWEYLADTPEDFDNAIKNAASPNEKKFFEKMLYKVLHETAFSNDVLMKDDENDDALYIMRVGTDDILVGRNLTVPGREHKAVELAGICFAMTCDLYELLGRHVTLHDWLRERDYQGIHYDRNNDYL